MTPDLNSLVPFGVVFGIIGLIGVSYAAVKAWIFSRWLSNEMIKTLDTYCQSEAFKAYAIKATELTRIQSIDSALTAHDQSSFSHSGYTKMAESFVRAHIQLELEKHNESKVAHNVAFEAYPNRQELQGAISRLEQKMDNSVIQINMSLNNQIEKVLYKLQNIERAVNCPVASDDGNIT